MRQTSCGSGSRRRFGVTLRGTSKFRRRQQALIMAQEKGRPQTRSAFKNQTASWGWGWGIARRRPSTPHSGFGSGIFEKILLGVLPRAPRILIEEVHFRRDFGSGMDLRLVR